MTYFIIQLYLFGLFGYQKTKLFQYTIKNQKKMSLQQIWRLLRLPQFWKAPESPYVYRPSSLLPHHSFQSIYEVLSPQIPTTYEREQIFFVDGGHVSLDWINLTRTDSNLDNVPVVLVMHGMTGGSECKYVQIIAEGCRQRGYTALCLNSRGFNSKMTSPVPFIGLAFTELQATLTRIKAYFPNRPLHLVGLSLGGNYLMRYVTQNPNSPLLSTLKSVSLTCAPFDVNYVITNMNKAYQRYFLKYYIEKLVLQHDEMEFWYRCGLVDKAHLSKATTLRQFHERITEKIVGDPIDHIFDSFKISDSHINSLQIPTLVIQAKDDPMVGFDSIPISALKANQQVKLIVTEKGGHMCWFEGIPPTRWYPRAIFQFIDDVKSGKKIADLE